MAKIKSNKGRSEMKSYMSKSKSVSPTYEEINVLNKALSLANKHMLDFK